MTNAEKYLKDGVDLVRLDKELIDYICDQGTDNPYYTYASDFFKEQAKPTLTEDEKVILKNIKNFTTIIRNIEGNIQVENEDGSFACLCAFNHLFQSIKERRRISNKGVARR